MKAPFDGRIVELDPALRAGRWVSPKDQIALVATSHGFSERGDVPESDRWRLANGGAATFVADAPARPSVRVRIDAIATAAASEIDIEALASTHAGRIAVAPDARKRLVPAASQSLVRMSAPNPATTADMTLRGLVIAQGNPESLLAQVWRQTLKVLVRESGV